MKFIKNGFLRKYIKVLRKSNRKYPVIPVTGGLVDKIAKRPISFVIVYFSDEYHHNIVKSECINDDLNEVIKIDNTGNLFFQNLTEAINKGVSKARHSLIVVVHEDVLLPKGWQVWFESMLALLEEKDPSWGVLGAAGWINNNQMVGHFSDPSRYINTFKNQNFIHVKRLDEQILIFHRDRLIALDSDLPSIHHIGRDVVLTAKKNGMKTYAINAPTIHKYADKNGVVINAISDSSKIVERKTLRARADWYCSCEYISRKWPDIHINGFKPTKITRPEQIDLIENQLTSPVILLARGGSGSRLLSILCQDLGLFIGNTLNQSGDCLDMALAIYQGVIDKYQGRALWQKQRILPRLWIAGANMLLEEKLYKGMWGFKVPESLFLISEISAVFPNARFLHLVRDPLTTCLRRTHMTARLDNCIGRISLPLAYEHANIARIQILDDSPALHMAYTTIHQLDLITEQFSGSNSVKYKQIFFENLIVNPADCFEDVRQWLGAEQIRYQLEESIDLNRVQYSDVLYTSEIRQAVQKILTNVRSDYGYIA